jgi:hypothetical protein
VLLTAEPHHWYQLAWVDWVTIAGLPLALVGLYLTWRQARNAANSAKAAQAAIESTELKIRIKQLMTLIPQLRWIAVELEDAINTRNEAGARKQLDGWRWQAGNIQGILSAADPDEIQILRGLQQSVGLARVAGSALLEGGPVSSVCAKARASIVTVCDDLNTWLGKNSTQAS